MSKKEVTEDPFQRMALQALKRKRPVHRLLSRAKFLFPNQILQILKRKDTDPIAQILKNFATIYDDIFFVQIGSCDGVAGDPIYHHVVENNWAGVVVEPVPYNFCKLVENYRDEPRVRCEQVAISNVEEERTFFHIREAEKFEPPWLNQIGSFDLEHLLKHRVLCPNIEDYIVETLVPCITFQQLIERCKIPRIDLLHIDAEGSDFKIINQLDFSKYKPNIVLYEHLHMSEENRTMAQQIFQAQGYRVTSNEMDTIVYTLETFSED